MTSWTLVLRLHFTGQGEVDCLISFPKKSSREVVFCNDVAKLLGAMGVSTYSSEDLWLFIDDSKKSLKILLLNNGKRFCQHQLDIQLR